MVLDTASLTVETTVASQFPATVARGICERMPMVAIGSAWAITLTILTTLTTRMVRVVSTVRVTDTTTLLRFASCQTKPVHRWFWRWLA